MSERGGDSMPAGDAVSPGEDAADPVRDPGGAPVRLDATVRGRVQGVGFRVFAMREARYLDLEGFVANMPDGGVHVVAEGPRADLEALLERLEEGPPAGWVDRVLTRWEPARGIGRGFRIESGAHTGD